MFVTPSPQDSQHQTTEWCHQDIRDQGTEQEGSVHGKGRASLRAGSTTCQRLAQRVALFQEDVLGVTSVDKGISALSRVVQGYQESLKMVKGCYL